MNWIVRSRENPVGIWVFPVVLGILTGACHSADRLTDVSEESAEAAAPAFSGGSANSFAGGIPFGAYALPTGEFGERYNGGLRVIWAKFLLKELAEIKARGGRVVLSLTGNEKHYLGDDHHFSFDRWKQRVDEYRTIDFSSYIEDGTIIGHYLIDEPNDAFNWGGRPVPGSMVEQMAAYSKQLWPGMATIVRVDPGYLIPWAPYRHLDAAWAQYVTRKGTAADYIRRNIADAQRLGLMLVTGLNISKGDRGRQMSADLIESAGMTLLNESYPCAFISWQYDREYLERSDVRSAMEVLMTGARGHGPNSCRVQGREPPPDDPPPPPPPPEEDDEDLPASNALPTAAFTGDQCQAGVPCRFTDGSTDSDGSIAGRNWSFGEGSSSTEADPMVTFAAAGSYSVTLTVTDDSGASASVTREVNVGASRSAPAAAFQPPSCTARTRCQFADESSDSDGSIVSRRWDFGNGASSNQASPFARYARPGSYTVTLTVTDDDGATSTTSHAVTVAAASQPGASRIVLSSSRYDQNNYQYIRLSWTGATGSTVDVYRNGTRWQSTRNDGKYARGYRVRVRRTFAWRICEAGSSRCSNTVTTSIR